MKAKRLFVISLAVICVCAILLSLFFIFSIKDVKTNYNVTANCSVDEVENTLNSYEKENLLFLDLEEVKKDLEGYPYFEVISIEKNFPNVLNVTLKERLEVFSILEDEKLYVLDKTGFVLNCISEQSSIQEYKDKALIEINRKGVEIESVVVGEIIKTDDQELFTAMLSMAEVADYTDTFKSVELDKMAKDEYGEPIISNEYKYVNFQTNTGVVIRIVNGDDRGTNKITKALDRYYRGSDYEKARSVIEANYLLNSEEIYTYWEEFDPRRE